MKVILGGQEVKCYSFAELKTGDVFKSDCCNCDVIYIKTANPNQVFNLCTNALENFSGAVTAVYPDAQLVLDPVV